MRAHAPMRGRRNNALKKPLRPGTLFRDRQWKAVGSHGGAAWGTRNQKQQRPSGRRVQSRFRSGRLEHFPPLPVPWHLSVELCPARGCCSGGGRCSEEKENGNWPAACGLASRGRARTTSQRGTAVGLTRRLPPSRCALSCWLVSPCCPCPLRFLLRHDGAKPCPLPTTSPKHSGNTRPPSL